MTSILARSSLNLRSIHTTRSVHTTARRLLSTMKASIDNTTLAESSDTVVVEGNHYFPPASLKDKEQVFTKSATTSVCPWKGTASYYDVKLSDGKVVKDAAWYYPDAYEKAKNIEGYVAFYKTKVSIV